MLANNVHVNITGGLYSDMNTVFTTEHQLDFMDFLTFHCLSLHETTCPDQYLHWYHAVYLNIVLVFNNMSLSSSDSLSPGPLTFVRTAVTQQWQKCSSSVNNRPRQVERTRLTHNFKKKTNTAVKRPMSNSWRTFKDQWRFDSVPFSCSTLA